MKASNKANMDIKHVSGLGILIGVSFLWQKTSAQNSTHCVTGTTHCSWEDWGSWSACSKTCGTGTRSRQRGLCCTLKQTFEQCVTSCGLKDSESLETETCSFVCPAGNCTYEKILNTGIEVTDFKTLTGADGKITNAPLHLISPTEKFCKVSCEYVNFHDGNFCWAYTWNTVTKCYLHFYKGPLVVARPELKGNHTGDSINIRTCTEYEGLESSTSVYNITGHNATALGSSTSVYYITGHNSTALGSSTRVYNITGHNDTGLQKCKDGESFNKCDTHMVASRLQSSDRSPVVLTTSLVPLMIIIVTVAVISGVLIRRKFLNSKQVAPVGQKQISPE